MPRGSRRVPGYSRKTATNYKCVFGRRKSSKCDFNNKYGFNICVTQLKACLRVYEMYRGQRCRISSQQNYTMAELDFLYHGLIQSGDKVGWVEKTLFIATNDFLYIIYRHFIERGSFEFAQDVQLAYLTEFVYKSCESNGEG